VRVLSIRRAAPWLGGVLRRAATCVVTTADAA